MNPQTEKKEMGEFVEAINTKQWNKALEISNALVYDDLQWKGLLNVGLLIAHYHINNGKIPLAPIDACLNRPKNGIYDGCLTEIKKRVSRFRCSPHLHRKRSCICEQVRK